MAALTSSWLAPAGAASSIAPWPMFGHDPQHTNRSPFTGPLHPRLLVSWSYMYPYPVIASDGSIYGWTDKGLARLDASLNTMWTYPAYELDGGPVALATDGSLRAAGFTTNTISVPTSAILALSTSGALLWKIQPAAFTKGEAPLVTDTGRLYIPYVGPTSDYQELDVVSSNGTVLQRLLHGSAFYVVAEGRDGTIYALHADNAPSQTYSPFVALSGFRADGKRLWSQRIGLSSSGESLLVGQDRSVYAAVPGKLVKYTATGHRRWSRKIDNDAPVLAERSDGSILVGDDLGLAAFSNTGRQLWDFTFRRPRRVLGHGSSLIVDAAGTAYIGTPDGTLRVVSSQGKREAKLPFGSKQRFGSQTSLALTADGKLAAVDTDLHLRIYGR